MSDLTVKATVKGRFVGGGLFEPKEQENGGKPKFSACIVLDEGQDEKVEEIIENALNNKWGKKRPPGLQNWGVREGDDPEFEASFERNFINPKSTSAPKTLVKVDGVATKVTQEERVIYAGCYVAVSISAYAYDGDKKKGIKPGVTLNVRAVMFLKDGERLGDSVDVDEEFEGFDSDLDDDDMFGE